MGNEKRINNLKRKDIFVPVFLIFGILLGIVLIMAAAPSFNVGTDYYHAGSEDTAFSLNLSQNVTDPENDTIYFYLDTDGGINSTNSLHNGFNLSDFDWISINETTGIFVINVTNSNSTDGEEGNFTVSIKILDEGGSGLVELFYFNITSVNDAPVFVNLANQSFNISELFEYNVNVTDEENNIPFVLNISFINCSVAEWSTRNCSNSSGRELFDSSDYDFNTTNGVLNISFTPSKNDVGSYIINFSVMDNSSLGNQTTTQLVNFTVLNMNSAPYFRYVCDNERNATEDSEFTCWINVSDIDEINNLTITANYSWFTFNSTSTNSVVKIVNLSTNYNASVMVNFTANDSMVGNWSVNISITDIGEGFNAPKTNSTVFWFFINNTEDSVSLDVINNLTVYENSIIYVNASDDDLLVPDKSVKNEVLTFASNTSWVNISTYSSSDNYTTAKIEIDFDTIFPSGDNNYTINVNVTDVYENTAEREFVIRILADTAAEWNSSMEDAFIIYEGNETYFNFSLNVTDAESDSLTFSFINDSAFSSFSINSSTGIINFTAIDVDVGYHNITINASDGKLDSLKSFNFTVLNINDDLVIETPLTGNANLTIDANSNINITEDDYSIIELWIQDDDFKILSNQKSYYNESLTVNLSIEGPNEDLFSFTKDSSFPTTSGTDANRSHYTATFTPNKTDVGAYNITINITDLNNASDLLEFNLTIIELPHDPVLDELENQTTKINQTFNYDMDATDSEDGADSEGSLTFSYDFLSGTDFLNTTTFNSTIGEINITLNSSHGGKYHINITVNDTTGAEDSDDFWIHIYDVPVINLPSSSYNFSLTENSTSNLVFQANHSVGYNLTYLFYIDSISYVLNFTYGNLSLRKNQSYYGNATNLTWSFAPNFTDETYALNKNLTLIVFSSLYPELNASQNWNLNISHANAPITFETNIGKQSDDYNTAIIINLTEYFNDYDFLDSYVNQTFNFSFSSDTSPSYIAPYATVSSNWILTLPAPLRATDEFLTINATDLDDDNSSLTSVLSNAFEVEFTTPSTTPTPTPSSGGGGGSIATSFKIITVGAINFQPYKSITIPVTLRNKGKKGFGKIYLNSTALKNGISFNKIDTSLDMDSISSLGVGKEVNLSLTVFINTPESGDYEIEINAISKTTPKYSDSAIIQIASPEFDETPEIGKLLIYAEEFLSENPECLDLKEFIDEAKRLYGAGELEKAMEKADEAIEACKEYVSNVEELFLPSLMDNRNILFYLVMGIIGSILLGASFNLYKKIRFRKGKKVNDDSSKKREQSEKLNHLFKNKIAASIFSLFLLGLLMIIKPNLTGFIVSNPNSIKNSLGIFYFIFIVGILGLFVFIYRKKVVMVVKKTKEKIKKKPAKNSIHGLIIKKVYTSGGDYIGKIEEVILKKNKIDSLQIKLDKKGKLKTKKTKGIIVKYSEIKATGHIVIVNEGVIKEINKLKKK